MRQRRHQIFWFAVITFILCGVVQVSAGRLDLSTVLCIDEIIDLEPERSWIPVGCEVVDCCPGCPGPPIDWRINVRGDLLEAVVLKFENLAPEQASQLGIKGTGRWEGTNLQVGKGETLISGFNVGGSSALPVAVPRLVVNKEGVRRLQQTAAGEADAGKSPADQDKDRGQMEVLVEQMIGDYVVNEFRFIYRITRCPRPVLPSDKIDLDNNTTNDSAVILLDGRTGSTTCADDTIFRGSDIIDVGSVLTNGACNSEVAVFSDDNAMQFLTPVNSWTDPTTDVLRVNMTPILHAPVTFWLVRAGELARATGDLANANLLYNSNNVGIAFDGTFQDISGTAGAANTIGTGCANIGAIAGSAFFTPNRLNVYYVDSAFTGVNCTGNRNIIFVGTTANNQTLAHEFGHSFSLSPANSGGHTNGLPGFDGTNIMQGGGAGRTHFSEGQAFRMNVNVTSTINVNGVRTGPVRNPACAPLTTSNICPALALNATPK